jgi:calcium-dependent protein kinase
MGSICPSKQKTENLPFSRGLRLNLDLGTPISNERDLIISPSSFVKKNKKAFYSQYRVENFPLGSGARGDVRICIHLSSKDRRVVKIIEKSSLPKEVVESESVFEEVSILKNLDHPNLPRIYEFFTDESSFYIVLEFCKGGDLFDRIIEVKNFTEAQAAEIMLQILSGINYLHSKGIVHRDIKPENILFSERNSYALKIIDFDTATFFGNEHCKGMFGTVTYMAPEVIKGKYNEKCDLWSCGIILYILLCGHPPFDGTNKDLFKIIKAFQVSFESRRWEKVSENAKDLLKKLLENDPTKRISAAEACMHPWITDHCLNVPNEDIKNVIDRLKRFKRTSKLKEAIHTFIISKILDPRMYKTEESVFKLLDSNRDGSISKQELSRALASDNVPIEEASMCAESIMEQVDSDLNGCIDYTEFLRASVRKDLIFTKPNLLQAFKVFDQDENGTIEMEELKKWLSDDAEITNELLENIMKQADINGDGKIDLFEFETLLFESFSSLEEPNVV